MAKAIAGFFRTPQDGEAAQRALLDAGFAREEVSFLTGDTQGHETPAVGPITTTGSESEAVPDAWIGGVVGIAAGMIATAIPGIGPLLAIGPLAGAIGGLSIGAAAGGLIGLLRDQGISEEEAEFYAEGVKRGGSLVTVHDVPDDRAGKARDILKERGAIDTETLAEEHARMKKV
jgi:hypothetical protein